MTNLSKKPAIILLSLSRGVATSSFTQHKSVGIWFEYLTMVKRLAASQSFGILAASKRRLE
jgi:hypothetical protein